MLLHCFRLDIDESEENGSNTAIPPIDGVEWPGSPARALRVMAWEECPHIANLSNPQ